MKKAWPDESARKAFFDKYSSYYGPIHSEEIYASVAACSKDLQIPSKNPMIVYVHKSQMSLNGQGKRLKRIQ